MPTQGLPFGQKSTAAGRRIVFHREVDAIIIAPTPASVNDIEKATAEEADGTATRYEFVVSTHALGLALPIWAKMLRDPDHNQGPDGMLVVNLPAGTDPEAFAVLLHIIHWELDKVPEKPSVELLYELAVLADKYDCDTFFHPFLASWMSDLVVTAAALKNGKIALELLWIGHVFGNSDIRGRGLEDLVLHSRIIEGHLVAPSGRILDETTLHSTTKSEIAKIRDAAMAGLLAQLQSKLTELCNRATQDDSPRSETGYGSDQVGTHKFCRSGNEDETKTCEVLIYGSAIASLSRAGLYPTPAISSKSLDYTLAGLSEKLQGLKLMTFQEGKTPPHACRHRTCGLGLDTKIDLSAVSELVVTHKTGKIMAEDHATVCGSDMEQDQIKEEDAA